MELCGSGIRWAVRFGPLSCDCSRGVCAAAFSSAASFFVRMTIVRWAPRLTLTI